MLIITFKTHVAPIRRHLDEIHVMNVDISSDDNICYLVDFDGKRTSFTAASVAKVQIL